MLSMIPPDPTTLNPRDLKQLHFMMQRFRELSSDERYTLIQLMTMSAADFLDQWFETDALKATMSASGIIGTFLGIRSPGTAYVLLHHYMGEIDGAFRSWGFSRGGTGAISNAIGAAAREAGVEIRTQAPVDKILVKERPRRRSRPQIRRRNLRQRRFFQRRPASHVRKISRSPPNSR